jgi:hypothetical protein
VSDLGELGRPTVPHARAGIRHDATHAIDESVLGIGREAPSAALGERRAERFVAPELQHRISERVRRARIDEQAGVARLLAQAADVGGDDGPPEVPCFDRRNVVQPSRASPLGRPTTCG